MFAILNLNIQNIQLSIHLVSTTTECALHSIQVDQKYYSFFQNWSQKWRMLYSDGED